MSNLLRRSGNQGNQPRGPGPGGQQPLVCPSCGLRNDPSARFCRNCGLPLGWAQDPVRGTTTRRADLPSERGAGVASIIGLLAAVAVLAVAGYVVLHGSGSGGTPSPTHTPSPKPSVGLTSPGPSGSGVLPSNGVTSPLPSAAVTDAPSQPASEPPGTLPATIDFTCDTGTISDPTLGHWKVTSVTWQRFAAGGYDRVVLGITRDGESVRSGTIRVETLTLNQVSALYGMNAPQNADRAVVVTFERRVNGYVQSPVNTSMNVVPNLSMGQGSDGLWHVVLGVVGQGCHRIGVPLWDSNPTATDAQLQIDVKK